VEPEVETRHGRIRGRRAAGLAIFLGVPYARAPVGDRRLRPPEPPDAWSGIRSAQEAGPAAPQNPGLVARLLGAGVDRCGEDCLYLNVWTPACDGARRPVLVWLHGGGFTTGSGSMGVYDGSHLARRGDVVVVTLNYRLGALGYLALSAAADEEGGSFGNLGLRDQIEALRWVRDHIDRFGGDPGNVTLFGESAGAMSVGTILAAPSASGLFARAVLQSGAAGHVHDRETAERVAETFMKEMGFASGNLAAVRGAPVASLLEAQQRTVGALAHGGPGLAFQPVVDGDLLPQRPLDAVRAGVAASVPMLIGTNRDEWKLYGLTDPGLASLDLAGLLRRCARNLPGGAAAGASRAERLVEGYRRAREGRASLAPRDLWCAIESDRHFRYPATQLAEAHAAREPHTYAYLFTWESPALGGVLGACHALDVPFVFGAVAEGAVSEFVGDGPAARTLTERMQDAWLAFARDGRPGHPGLGDWPAYEAGRRATMILGERCGVEDAPQEAERALWDAIA
jgi:para-nitrobenzyl esterase